MKNYFSYVRVSTTRQGQTGTSLAEQREAIHRYAEINGLKIVREYEEQQTAAKRGRSVFTEMMRTLKRGGASGVIMHKVDRSARNLRDWAELGDLIDTGIEIHFVNENLDMETRGGRLSADIQAVIAADYIRNLREEVKKGIYGRIKQGLLPMPAPDGYLDRGKGQPKEIDPNRGPLIRQAFESYSRGNLGLHQLADQMHDLGMRAKSGRKIYKSKWALTLRNPFYSGVIRIKKSGELYAGKHKALIEEKLFNRVQALMDGRLAGNKRTHDFLFRRLLHCAQCGRLLIGELQKQRVYYRCHSRGCPQKTVREDVVEYTLITLFKELRFTDAENAEIRLSLAERYKEAAETRARDLRLYNLQLEHVRSRLSTLMDGYLDGTFDREMYLEKKNSYVREEQGLKEKIEKTMGGEDLIMKKVELVLELVNNAYLSYKRADRDEKREMVETMISNLEVKDKTLTVKLKYPFKMVADRLEMTDGRAPQDVARTITALISRLCEHFRDGNKTLPQAE